MHAPDFEQALQTLENLRQSVEQNYRESQETGNVAKANMAIQRFTVRARTIRKDQPAAFAEWLKGNSRFLQAVEQGRNPILC